ncbi:DUF5361 domain-containing protein [Streptomyces sp. STCH 565 A]|uniref:DUF5361 domain-containing protein n=1 Tax=Streptomyces sp. STCH 565 A TaxID=2950532 RepID=UPI0020754AD9|nr:DUF5361 domain-containing protein [Streptomyces sp. STCH 565 A]MCM8548884.1 DUF5361 domain-containing protein [Streptomyces sp. STCH 565 A]
MTSRRLRVLIQHLPPESATMTALRNAMSPEELAEHADEGEPEKGRWSQTEQLLALIADRAARLEHITLLANSSKGSKKPKPPEPVRRPGTQPPKAKPKPSSAGTEWLFQMINGAA